MLSLLKKLLIPDPSNQNLPIIIDLKRLAESNDPDAMCLLGDCYFSGAFIKKHERVALKWYNKAALLDHSGAQIRIGEYQIKDSVEHPNIPNANVWFERAAKNAKPEDNLRLGSNSLRTWQDDKALPLLQAAANHGLVEAYMKLAHIYKYGSRVEKDVIKYFEWTSKAAALGHMEAIKNLGIAYKYGKGVQPDKEKAFQLFRNSALLGDVNANFQVAICYYFGIGVKQDQIEARRWNLRAADLGAREAQHLLGWRGGPMDWVALNL